MNFEVIRKFWQSYGPGLLRFRLMQELYWLFCVINFTFPQGIISDTYSQLLTIGYDYLVPANKHDSDLSVTPPMSLRRDQMAKYLNFTMTQSFVNIFY